MANGKVVIDTLLDPSGFQKGLSGLQKMAPRGGNLFGRMFGGFGQFAKWTMGLQAIRSGISAVTAGFDEGIDRFDTMQRFPRMMQQIGFSAQDAEATIKRLSDEITGLPTALDDITATTQRLTMMTGDMEKGADIALAMNNAFLASGASTADASRGMTQFTQMLSKGKPDMMAWNTLVETMPVALRMINKELGYSENDLYALYDALQEGEITYDDFTEAVIRASEAEGGFAEMARENSKGIRTSLTNLGIAFSRGWAEVLESINNGLQSIGIDGITGLLDGIRPHIDSFFDSLTAGIDTAFDGIRQLNEIFGWFDIPDESETLDNTAESAKNASAEIEELARQVINGDFGNGQERVEALGEQYQEIQDVVNAILNGDYEALEIEVETEQVKNAEKDLGRHSKSFGKIADNIRKIGEGIFDFFGPANDLLQDLIDISLDSFGGYVDSVEKLFEGDWSGAWDTFKETAIDTFDSVVRSLERNVPKIWNNLRSLGSDVSNWISNIDWSGVASEIGSFFSELGDVVTSVDWQVVAGEVGGAINDFVSATTAWLDENMPEVIDYALEVLLNPRSKLNQDASEFVSTVEGALDVFMAELLGLEDRDFFVNLRAEPIFSWERWNRLFQEAEQKIIRDTVNFQNTIQQWFKAFDNPELEVGILAQILNLEHQGWSDEEIQAEIDRVHGDGTYEFQMTLRPSANVEELDIAEQLEIIKNAYGSNKAVEILQEVKAEIELAESEGTSPEDIQSQINEKYGTGMYEVVTDIATKIGELEAGETTEQEFWKSLGELYDLDIAVPAEITPEAEVNTSNITGDTLQQKLDNILADQTMTVDQKIEMIYELLEGQGIEEGYIENYLREQFPGHTFDLEAGLKVTPTSAVLGMNNFNDVQVPQGVDLSTTTDQTVEVMASDGSVQVMSMTVDENGLPTLEPVDVSDQLELTGTADTSGLTAIQDGYSQMQQHVQRMMQLAVTAVRMGGAQMNMALAVSGGRMASTSTSISNRVVAIFNAMRPRMHSAGVNAGNGFADGLESTRGRIMNVAQSIANSASETIQNALDIHSPSRLWTSFGQFTGLGFAGGLDNTRSLVNQSALRLAEAGIPDFNAMSHALKSQSAPDASRIGGSMRDSTLLTEIRDAIRSGQVINLDGRNVSRGTSKYDNQYLGQAYQRGAYNAW